MNVKHWKRVGDDGALHVLGNGQMCAYEEGPVIEQVFGPPYSGISLGRLALEGIETAESVRTPGTDIWTHSLADGSRMTDLIDSEQPCLIRKIEAAGTLRFTLALTEWFTAVKDTEQRWLFHAEKGSPCYTHPSDYELFHCIEGSAAVRIEQTDARTFILSVPAGEHFLWIASRPQTVQAVKDAGYAACVERTRVYWAAFLARGRKVPEQVREICEGVAVLVKAQQGLDGGVLAGFFYHMAYVRDQYGVSRGLLKLGYLEEAKAILSYYHRIWQRYGHIKNAQSIGTPGIFHIHENDEVEITGYLVVQAFDIYKAGGGRAYLDSLLPMLKWALEVQMKHLKNDMLPFNGDETYIAGGFLPRYAMYDGSSEATMLFLTGLDQYIAYTNDSDGWSAVAKRVRARYAENFVRGGGLITNNPARLQPEEYPAERWGVCEECCHMAVLKKTAAARYLCPDCYGKKELPVRPRSVFQLTSAAFAPLFIGADVVPMDVLAGMVNEAARRYEENHALPSDPEGRGGTVGYDYGFFLNALTKVGHPLAAELYKTTLALVDEAGAWSEYYRDGKSYGCRCRPWESAINIYAVLTYLESLPA